MRVEAVKRVVNSLPPAHKSFLRRTLRLLCKIAENEASTKMSATNIAIVFSPTFLRRMDERDPLKMLNDQVKSNDLIKLLIEKYDFLFDIITNQPPSPSSSHSIPPKLVRQQTLEEKVFINSFTKSSVLLAKALLLEHRSLLSPVRYPPFITLYPLLA